MMKISTGIFRTVVIAAGVGLLCGELAAADLHLPVNVPLSGVWVSSESSDSGRLEASLKPVGEGEYEMFFKVTGSSIFNPAGKPYPDEGVYPLKLERKEDDVLSFTYRQPFPRIPALFFIPSRLRYRVTLEGPVKVTAPGRWRARVNDHNLALELWVRPGLIAGTYDYDGRWASAAGSFRLTVDPRERHKATDRRLKRGSTTAD